MTIQECYLTLKGDYSDAIRRFGTDEKIARFLNMLKNDGNYELLKTSVANEDYANAFSAAHTIKGMALNMSLNAVANSISELTEILRPKVADERIAPALESFCQIYDHLLECISLLD